MSDEAGVEINNDGELIKMLTVMAAVKTDYDSLRSALDAVRSGGYGVVMPLSGQVQLDEPQIVRQGGKYTVRLKARAPVIHMLMTDVETEVSPAIGGESASEDIINFLLQGFDGDVNQITSSESRWIRSRKRGLRQKSKRCRTAQKPSCGRLSSA